MSATVKDLKLSHTVATADETAALTLSLNALRESFQTLVTQVGLLAERVEQITTMPVDVKKNSDTYTIDVYDDGEGDRGLVVDKKEKTDSSSSGSDSY